MSEQISTDKTNQFRRHPGERMMPTKRVLLIVVSLIAVALLGIYLVNKFNFVDFPVYYQAGTSLLAGRTDLYSPDFALGKILDYRYPPLFIIVFSPLSLLPFKVAAYVWYWLCILEIAACFYLVKKLTEDIKTEGEKLNSNRIIWVLTALAVGQYFVAALKYGNAHLLVTLLLFGSFYLLTRRRDGWAAFLMSLAITIKLIPLIALPYFALKKRWLFLSLTTLYIIVLNLAPALCFGFDKNLELLETWYKHVVVNQQEHEKDSSINLSLKGQLRRYAVEIDYSQQSDGTENTDRDYEQINLISISEKTSNRIWIGASFLVFAGCLLVIWISAKSDAAVEFAAPDKKENWRLLVEYSLIVCLILFVGPLTSKIYFVKMLLPFACLAAVVFNSNSRADKISRLVLYSIAAVNILLPLLPGRWIQRFLLIIGTDFYMLCLLMIIAIFLLISRRPQNEITTTRNGFQIRAVEDGDFSATVSN